MKITYPKAIFFCGLVWGFVGYKLVSKGIVYFNALFLTQNLSEGQLSFWIGISLLVGLAKGKFLLQKSANRVIQHIVSFEEPLKIYQFLPRSFLITMMIMMSLGMTMKYIPISVFVKGMIDLTVGTALVFGAIHFVKKAWMIRLALKKL
ncbi:MAG: hypothetical protein EBU93_00420 [Chlamydiae bacterium]|nr:hypothetical protein [Chlamydiota bacterium]